MTDTSYDPALFDRLARVEETSFWFRARNRLIVWALRRYFPDAQTFLEVGCGTGYVLAGLRHALPQLALTGAEPYGEGLAIARRRVPDAELIEAHAETLPYDGVFDVVGAFDVLEHIESDRAALSALARAARPGGGVLLAVPQHPWLWSAADVASGHRRRYRRRDLLSAAAAADLEILRVTSFVSLLLPLLVLSRLRTRKAAAGYDVVAELRLGRSTNGLLDAVMRVEAALLRAGVTLPMGGSLLLVARRRAPE